MPYLAPPTEHGQRQGQHHPGQHRGRRRHHLEQSAGERPRRRVTRPRRRVHDGVARGQGTRRQGLTQGEVAGEHRARLERAAHGQRRRDPDRARYQRGEGHTHRRPHHQHHAAGAQQPRPGPQPVDEPAEPPAHRHPGQQRPRPAHPDAPLFEQRRQDEFGQPEQGQTRRARDIHRPGPGQHPQSRPATAVVVRTPGGRQKPQARDRRRHQGGGQQQRDARRDAEGQPGYRGRRGGPHAGRQHRLDRKRLRRRPLRDQRGEQRAQPAGGGGRSGPGHEREPTENGGMRARYGPQSREPDGPARKPGSQVQAGPLIPQPHPENRSAHDLTDDIRRREHRAQRVAAGPLAHQEHQGQRGHGNRHTSADSGAGPDQHLLGRDIAVAHETTVGAATDTAHAFSRACG